MISMETKNKLSRILDFVSLINEFQKVERRIFIVGQNKRENDVEHSYQLAMVAWYMASLDGLNFDKDLLIKYALVHDLVEVYAGDTYLFTTDSNEKDSKADREKAAAERLNAELPEFKELNELIHKYESRDDVESKFIYALDKILPVLNIYLDNGRTWQHEGVTFEMIFSSKVDKVQISPEVRKYFDEIVSILKTKEDVLFNKK